jgi:hypothetical protein
MAPTLKQYAFWEEDGEDCGYWMTFDDLSDAVVEAKGREIFEQTSKRLGHFTIKTSVVKAKKSSKPKK